MTWHQACPLLLSITTVMPVVKSATCLFITLFEYRAINKREAYFESSGFAPKNYSSRAKFKRLWHILISIELLVGDDEGPASGMPLRSIY